MSKSKQAQLEDAVKTVQALSTQTLTTGAKCLLYSANDKLSNEFFSDLCKNLLEGFKDTQPKMAEELVQALKDIRALCLENVEAVKYVNDQANKMAEIAATKDFFTEKYTKKDDKDKGGCRIM